MTTQPIATQPRKIPLVDLSAQFRSIDHEMTEAIRQVVERGDFILGEALNEFEAAFARYCGVPHAVGVASGTDALFLTLRALGVRAGDEVIVPAMTFAATAEAVAYCGARPVLVDVCPDDLLLDPEQVRAAITSRTRGIIAVHLYGMMADLEALSAISGDHDLWLLEDAAQAHGARWRDKRAGSLGVAGCFSFYPAKNLGAYGDAGAITTADGELADRIRLLRHHGQRRKYEHLALGYCSRLDNLQAAVLNVKLRHLDEWTHARVAAAQRYDDLIGDRLPRVGSNRRDGAVHHIYAVRVDAQRRDALVAKLNARGIEASVHYPIALTQVDALVELSPLATAPVAERAAGELVSLPIYPEISPEQQQRVVDELFAAI
jgi:dTDP-4-amino-4,6-dideoxygalactose transaminase